MKKSSASITSFYEKLIKPILEKDNGVDAECLTNLSLKLLSLCSDKKDSILISYFVKRIKDEFCIQDQRLSQEICGINFSNPVGLAAGFDKNGIAANLWQDFGFGFSEIGTVTKYSQPGNPKPRLFRISREKAALNRMGFNNNGADFLLKNLIKQNLHILKEKNSYCLGINFGKSKITELSNATDDYISSLKILIPYCSYAAINVSSPNTEGLRKLQDPILLTELLREIKKLPKCPPLFVKIAPDLSFQEIDDICQIINDEKINGIIATNTSLNRLGLENTIIEKTGSPLSEEKGGLSGRPLKDKATQIIKHIHNIDKKLILIGVGGIDSPKAAWERIVSGASLIQIYTGWIYEGPILVPNILKGILKQLNYYQMSNIKEAIGTGLLWRN
tara:strand:+ start:1400 stop:2569 length:1170 start_codon:yes stop_codon:yes gene_type:complete